MNELGGCIVFVSILVIVVAACGLEAVLSHADLDEWPQGVINAFFRAFGKEPPSDLQ